jgi:hypothetical protein
VTDADKQTEHNSAANEPDVIPMAQLALWLGVLVALLIGIGVALWQYFDIASQQERLTKDLARPSITLEEIQQRDRTLLANYSLVDPKKGVYRIPVARAMELLATNPGLLLPAAPQPTSMPASMPATPVDAPAQAPAAGASTQPTRKTAAPLSKPVEASE